MTGQPLRYSRAILAAALCAASLGWAHDAAAQNGSLRDNLFRKPGTEGRQLTMPPVARYVAETGQTFILDRTQTRPLLKFDDAGEIWVLAPQPAPRGDVIFKNDVGEPVLRATRLGGVTLFTEDRPAGAAAAPAGPSPPIRLAPIGPQAVAERLLQASARASRAARRLIPFEGEATPASSALVADAAMVASEAMVRMSRNPRGRVTITRILKVRLSEGRRGSAELVQGTLQITVAPPQGLAGRPSSERIVKVASAAP